MSTNSDRSWAKCLAYLLFIFLTVEILVRSHNEILRDYDPRSAQGDVIKEAIYARIPVPDLCFLGSSRADQGFRSDLFKGLRIAGGTPIRTTFNYGIGGGLGNTIVHSIRPMLARPTLPKVVIWEVSDFALNANWDDLVLCADPGFVWQSRKFERFWICIIVTADAWIERLWSFYRYRVAIEHWCYDLLPRDWGFTASGMVTGIREARVLTPEKLSGDCLVMSGCSEDKLSDLKKHPDYDGLDTKMRGYRIDPAVAAFLQSSLKSLQARDVKVILVHIPTAYEAGLEYDYSRFLSRVADAHHIPFFDFSRSDCDLTDDDYRDPSHLGVSGGVKFSECVKRRISATVER